MRNPAAGKNASPRRRTCLRGLKRKKEQTGRAGRAGGFGKSAERFGRAERQEGIVLPLCNFFWDWAVVFFEVLAAGNGFVYNQNE